MATGSIPNTVRQAGVYFAFAFEQLTIANTAKALTATKYRSGERYAQTAFITVETADIRYTFDGTTPTATVGHLLTDGSSLTLKGTHDIENFQAYRTGAVSAIISVTYEG